MTWTKRFITAAIIHGMLAAILTLYIVLGQIAFLKPEVSRVIALGSAGTWFTMGYLTYLIVGVVGTAVMALFYHYLENISGKQCTGLTKLLAWIHLLFMNIGVIGATWLLMISGYQAGAALLPQEVGGKGWNPGQVHLNIFYGIPLGYPFWISASIILLSIGVIAGGLGYLITWLKET